MPGDGADGEEGGIVEQRHKVPSDWDARIWIDGVGDAERRLEVTPAIAGWESLSFRSYTFRAGQVIAGEPAADEMAMVLLSGAVTIEAAGPGWRETWDCRGRESVFAGPPYAIYLPPGHTYRTTVHADADCAYGRAPAAGTRSPRLVRPDDLAGETDRDGTRITRVLGPGDTEHLACQEAVVAGGAWSAVPPHRHELQNPDAEAYLEEVSYYRMQPEAGWARQRLSTDDGTVDESLTIRHGDAVIVRRGDHPLVASPGTRVYMLSFLAGPVPEYPA